MLGATDAQLAELFAVSRETIYNWKAAYPEFFDTIRKARDVYDTAAVEVSLLRRAKGWKHKAVHISNYKGQITKTPYIERFPPDTAAAFIWLKNRHPDRWKDKQEIDHKHSLVPAVVGEDGER